MKDRLRLFVHGLGGGAKATWRARDELGFPELNQIRCGPMGCGRR